MTRGIFRRNRMLCPGIGRDLPRVGYRRGMGFRLWRVSELLGYQDFERDDDGRVTAVPVTSSGLGERVSVRVSVERTIERGGEVVAQGEVASSDRPAGELGSMSFG